MAYFFVVNVEEITFSWKETEMALLTSTLNIHDLAHLSRKNRVDLLWCVNPLGRRSIWDQAELSSSLRPGEIVNSVKGVKTHLKKHENMKITSF